MYGNCTSRRGRRRHKAIGSIVLVLAFTVVFLFRVSRMLVRRDWIATTLTAVALGGTFGGIARSALGHLALRAVMLVTGPMLGWVAVQLRNLGAQRTAPVQIAGA